MPNLGLIFVWPPTGFPDRPWLEQPDEDAFARSARSVCELYSDAIRQAAIPARHSELHLACHHDPGRDDVLVTVHPELKEGFELAVALLPDGIAALPAAARATLVLEVVHAAATRLGLERGWDQAALRAARDHALAAGLRFRWESPAKTSPDRRHTAHAAFALQDDGYGRVVLQVRRRADGHVVAGSPPALAFSTSAGFARSAATLRWRSSTVVELTPYAGLSAGVGRTVLWADNHGLLRVDLSTDGPTDLPPGERHAPAAPAFAVTVQTPADAGPTITVVGGGPVTRAVPDAYLDTLHGLLDQLGEPPWQAWWAAAGDRVLEIWYDFAAAAEGPAARRAKGTLKVTIRRPQHTFAAIRAAPAAAARDDVEAMLTLVRRRTGLGAPPPLR